MKCHSWYFVLLAGLIILVSEQRVISGNRMYHPKTKGTSELGITCAPTKTEEINCRIEYTRKMQTSGIILNTNYNPKEFVVKNIQWIEKHNAETIKRINDNKVGSITLSMASSNQLKPGIVAEANIQSKEEMTAHEENALRMVSAEFVDGEGRLLNGDNKSDIIIGQMCNGSCGDIDGNGKVTHADAEMALDAAMGNVHIDPSKLCVGDVAPQDEPDGQITLADAVLILRKVDGLTVFGCGSSGTIVSKPFNSSDVVYDVGIGGELVQGEVIIHFKDSVSWVDRDGFLGKYSLRVVGRNSVIDTWQCKTEKTVTVSSLLKRITADPRVEYAQPNIVGGMAPKGPKNRVR